MTGIGTEEEREREERERCRRICKHVSRRGDAMFTLPEGERPPLLLESNSPGGALLQLGIYISDEYIYIYLFPRQGVSVMFLLVLLLVVHALILLHARLFFPLCDTWHHMFLHCRQQWMYREHRPYS